jgi:copper homeostasis protein
MLLEICAYNIQSCIIAEKAGASRIELCADPTAGGTTPSYGTIDYALDKISIPIFPMIRPRGGNFVYDANELTIMKKDILTVREMGCPGIATGVLLNDGNIDTETMKRIVDWAHPMSVTCHKAFDRTPDALKALEDIISTGCARILTSGLKDTAINGATTIAQLVTLAANRIIIMPGGGVRSTKIAQLIIEIKATEYHSSGLLTKGEPYMADEQEITSLVDLLKG